MIIRKAFKFQLKTKHAVGAEMARFAGCCRFVWNKALDLQKKRLENKQSCLSYNKLAEELKNWKKETALSFLNDVHSQPLQQTLMNLDRAIREAFDKKNPKQFPQFKKKGKHDSFRYPQGFKLDNNNRVYLPKIGWVKFRKSRAIDGTVKNVTVSRHQEKWYVSIQTELNVNQPSHASTSIVGMDAGVVNFATLSNGEIFPSNNSYRKNEAKLKYLQRQLTAKKKFSQNWKKQVAHISKTHTKIARIRYDFLHKTSTLISKNHAVIVIEDLKISNMSRSAKGSVEAPGKRVRQKSGLNKSILDQGWSEFRRQLEYKQSWLGGEVIAVDPKNTSRECHRCHFVSKENRKTQSQFVCMSCEHSENADINAAKNILAAGHAVLAGGETMRLGRSMKQEPAEVTQAIA